MIDESTLLELPPLPRGRPSKEMQSERDRLSKVIVENRKRLNNRDDSAILEDIEYRFGMMERFTIAAAMGSLRSLVISGAAGVGKTFTVENTLESIAPDSHEIISGGDITPIQLHMAGYRNREAGNVLVFDDSDGVLKSDECMNIMKKLVDSSDVRTVCYPKSSPILEKEGIPDRYEFQGSVMFLSNLDIASMAEGTDRRAQHMKALVSRSLILSLNIHDPKSLYIWIRHKSLSVFERLRATQEERDLITNFLENNYWKFRHLSLRTIEHMFKMIRDNPIGWRRDVGIMLMK